MVPAVFQVTYACVYTLVLAFLIEQPLARRRTPRRSSRSCGWACSGPGLAYLCFFRLLGPWGATRLTMVVYVIPVVGIALGLPVPRRDDRRPDRHRLGHGVGRVQRRTPAIGGIGCERAGVRPHERRLPGGRPYAPAVAESHEAVALVRRGDGVEARVERRGASR